MKNNTITVDVHYVNGSYQTVLDGANPKDAIENYFFPDAGMPVTVGITAKTEDGRTVALSITKTSVNVYIE